jgi:tRNA(Arg) A34 adenosine deaminase TadA/flavin reductase (DIM6/NTAB) family NADH-FMN oxidoreductase RutF
VSRLFGLANSAVWLVSSRFRDERAGMIATWVCQVSLSAARTRAIVVLSVEARTCRVIARSGRFALQLLDSGQLQLVEHFALPTPGDRWEGVPSGTTRSGIPVADGGCGYVECAMVEQFDLGDRVVILGDVVEERVDASRQPLRERDALMRQPYAVAAALAKSYEIDVARDDRLLAVASRTPSDADACMRLAIAKTREGIARGQGPFGCAIVRDGELLAVEHNRVLVQMDMSAHAEIVALRAASRRVRHFMLPGAVVYATCEPCPMCLAALHFAEVAEVRFGAAIADAERAGFRQIPLGAAELATLAGNAVRVQGGLLAAECRSLFDQWRESMDLDSPPY